MSHGVGRSGDLLEAQPKAVGSTIVGRLACALARDAAVRGSGLTCVDKGLAVVLPVCTGMACSLVLRSLANALPPLEGATGPDVVLWSRIDQKSCLKSVYAAGMECAVVPTVRGELPSPSSDAPSGRRRRRTYASDEVRTDLPALRRLLLDYVGRRRVVAVISTTSCFAPRIPDDVDEIARICEEFAVGHVVNHAYGLQCQLATKLVNRAAAVGKVDAIVCSTDKNFLTPVGGSVVLCPDAEFAAGVGRTYPGRASGSPAMDLTMTLLSMGLEGYKGLLAKREKMRESFRKKLNDVAASHGERVLDCPNNTISFGITLGGVEGRILASLNMSSLEIDQRREASSVDRTKEVGLKVSRIGSMLFTRNVSGARVVPQGLDKIICGHNFRGFGSSNENYPTAYMTAACAIGMEETEIDTFVKRLDKVLKDFDKGL
uniref:O-phosphoseryl-tRNA(Sec) selenium transferase n=1 Tax=Corethron hystrix TaxID=216773 RepID=A0A7S1FM34_9STRA